MQERELEHLPETLASAVAEARQVLDTTRDPQLSDIVLDRACYRDMADLAEATGSAFLQGYVSGPDGRGQPADARCGPCGWGRAPTSSQGALLEGGDLSPDAVQKRRRRRRRRTAGAVRRHPRSSAAAEAGADALDGGPLTGV